MVRSAFVDVFPPDNHTSFSATLRSHAFEASETAKSWRLYTGTATFEQWADLELSYPSAAHRLPSPALLHFHHAACRVLHAKGNGEVSGRGEEAKRGGAGGSGR